MFLLILSEGPNICSTFFIYLGWCLNWICKGLIILEERFVYQIYLTTKMKRELLKSRRIFARLFCRHLQYLHININETASSSTILLFPPPFPLLRISTSFPSLPFPHIINKTNSISHSIYYGGSNSNIKLISLSLPLKFRAFSATNQRYKFGKQQQFHAIFLSCPPHLNALLST